MKFRKPLLVGAGILLLATPLVSSAYEGDWRRGNVYYRMVCTECHTTQAGGSIGPNTRTKAEWAAYLQADKHAKGKNSVKYFVSKQYRASIASTNKAAAKLADVPDEELLADVKAFVMRSAKDGDAPAGCR